MLLLLTIIFIPLFIIELTTAITYGKFLTYREVHHYMSTNKPFSLNLYDTSIVVGDSMKPGSGHISTVPFPLLSKYYIYGRGRVFRWSKASKELDVFYKNLLLNRDFS